MRVCVCFWLIYAAWPHRRLNVASLEATLWSRTRSIGQWHIIYVCLSSCLQGLFTHSHTHTPSHRHTQTELGGGATSMTTNQLKVLRPKSFACLRLSCDQTQSQIPSCPKNNKNTRITLFLPPSSLSLLLYPLCLSPLSGDFCRLAKVSWLINVPAAVWLFHVRHAHYLPPISIELKQLPRPPTPSSTI